MNETIKELLKPPYKRNRSNVLNCDGKEVIYIGCRSKCVSLNEERLIVDEVVTALNEKHKYECEEPKENIRCLETVLEQLDQALGEWAGVSKLYCPLWAQSIKEAQEEINNLIFHGKKLEEI